MADVQTDHQCQNECGRIAQVIIVRIGDSSADFLCDTCNVTMWIAVAEQIAKAAERADAEQGGNPVIGATLS